MRRRNHTRKGFNLIESAIVLGVVGLIIGGIWVAASAVMLKHRAQQTVDGFVFVAEKMKEVFGKTPLCSTTGRCVVSLNYQQLVAIIGTPPSGWRFNAANGTVDSPVFSGITVSVDTTPRFGMTRSTIGFTTSWTNNGDEAGCKAFGAMMINLIPSGTLTHFSLQSDNFILGFSTNMDGTTEAFAELDNGLSTWAYGLPDPLWAGGIAGCYHTEMGFPRE